MTLALENVRRLEEWSRGEHGDDLASAASPPIENVGILGAGMMGMSIAAAHVEHQVPVVVSDVDRSGSGRRRGLDRRRSAGGHSLATSSYVSELGPRNRRRGGGRSLRPRVGVDRGGAAGEAATVFAVAGTSGRRMRSWPRTRRRFRSSGWPRTLPDASRFCGMHFLHPVRHRRLVEIVRGPRTSDETIAAATSHVRRIGRMPIVVRDGPGFLVNRLLFPYLGEALELLREGVPAEAIERAASEFGMAIGPLRLMDEIGLDTTLQAGWVLAAAFPERIVSSPLLVSMVKAGRLGQKAGRGSMRTASAARAASPPAILDKAVDEIIGRWIDAPAKPSGRADRLPTCAADAVGGNPHSGGGQGRRRSRHRSGGAVRPGFSGRQGRAALVGGRLGAAAHPRHALRSSRDRRAKPPDPAAGALAKTDGRFYRRDDTTLDVAESIAAIAAAFQRRALPAAAANPW